MSHLSLVSLLVHDYDETIDWFTNVLGFVVAEDSPSMTNDGRPKRWVVIRPPDGQTGLVVARADGDEQRLAVGNQMAGRVGFFLTVDNFEETLSSLRAADAEILGEPRREDYGQVVVFRDLYGNKWDLLGE